MSDIHTHKEARDIFCPLGPFEQSGSCLGAGCMAWRWAPDELAQRRAADDAPDTFIDTPKGYCGLAGVPLLAEQVQAVRVQFYCHQNKPKVVQS